MSLFPVLFGKPLAKVRPGPFCLVAAALLWGTGGLAGTLLGRVAALAPLAVATYRLAGGGLVVLAALAVSRRPLRLTRAGWCRVLLVGLLTATYQACYFAAVTLISLALATVATVGSAPVLVLVVEAVRARRRPAPASLLAIGLALLGLVLLVGVPAGAAAPTGGRLVLGVLLALVAAAAFGTLALVGRRPVAGLDGPATVGLGFTVGGALLAAATSLTAGWTGGLGFAPTVASVGLLLYLGWVPTALAYALFFAGLRGVSASAAAVVAVLEPVTATVLGVLVLGQPLGGTGLLGAGLLCGAAVVAGARGTAAEPAPVVAPSEPV